MPSPDPLLTETETAALIRAATNRGDGTFLVLAYSASGRVYLRDVGQNAWARTLLTRLRCPHENKSTKEVGRCIRETSCHDCGRTWTDDSSD